MFLCSESIIHRAVLQLFFTIVERLELEKDDAIQQKENMTKSSKCTTQGLFSL